MRHLLIFFQFIKYLADVDLAVGRVHLVLLLQLHGQVSLVRLKNRLEIAAPLGLIEMGRPVIVIATIFVRVVRDTVEDAVLIILLVGE